MTANNNPYSPPKAAVADPTGDANAESLRRPSSVTAALALLAIPLATGIGRNVLAWMGASGTSMSIAQRVGQVCGVAFAVWVYYKIAQGRNWARILLLVLISLVGVFMAATWKLTMNRISTGEVSGLGVLIQILSVILDAVALYLLFGPGRAWFRRRAN
jgi:hypothetical protein